MLVVGEVTFVVVAGDAVTAVVEGAPVIQGSFKACSDLGRPVRCFAMHLATKVLNPGMFAGMR